MENNLLTAFLKVLKVKHTNVYSQKYFEEHPYNNSLYGLSTMLTHYRIENRGVQVKDISIDNLPQTPFVTSIGKSFVIVLEIANAEVKCLWNDKKINFTIDSFLKEWNGIVLIAQPDDLSIEPNYSKNRRNEIFKRLSKSLLFLSAMSFLLFFYIDNSIYLNIKTSILLILSLIGVYISFLLLSKEINGYNRSADYICSMLKQGDCNNILTSEYSQLLGLISWAEIGFSYFVFNLLVILLNPSWVRYVCIMNLFTLPYTFWSIWYQKYKMKTWCILCLSVQCILGSYFITGLFFGYLTFVNFNFIGFGIVGCLFIFCIIIINLLSTLYQQAKQKRILTYKINALKINEGVFVTLLKQQPYYSVSADDSNILFGNPDAKFKITIFSNPHCSPCRKMHTRVKVLLEARNDISVQYIFSSFNESLDTSNKFLCSVYINKPIEVASLIYDEWFSNVSHTSQEIFDKYKLDLESVVVQEEFDRHIKWKKVTGISATPTILVNRYQLPTHYTIEDLLYLTKANI